MTGPDLSTIAELPAPLLTLLRTSSKTGGNGERLPDAASILAGVPAGQRNTTLFRWACQLRRLLNDDRPLIEHLMTEANRSSPEPLSAGEVGTIIDSAFRQDHSDDAEKVGPDGVRMTEGGNGIRFARRYGDEMIFVADVGWFRWNGSTWEGLHDVAVEAQAKTVVTDLYTFVQDPSLSRAQKADASRFAIKTDANAGIRNMLAMARSDPGLLRYAHELNPDPLKLAVANGVVDLRTGELLPLSRHDLITGRSPYRFDPTVPTPRWKQFLLWAMLGDVEMVAFLQRLAGYSITGLFQDHIFPVMLGPGGNGKNTFIETLVEVLGELAEFPFATDAITDRDMNEKRTADLFGKRLAVISETNKRVPINAATLKSYTGDGRLKGRRLYKDAFTFTSTHTLWFMSNHRPKIADDSHGMWRRVLLIPWRAIITDAQKVPRYHELMLQDEGPGIVAWLVQGAVDYQRQGLRVPPSIRAASADYQQAEDTLGAFMDECVTAGPKEATSRARLKGTYAWWCDEHDVERGDRLAIRDLIDAIAARTPVDADARDRGNGQRLLGGISVTGGPANLWS